jgi:hypothetical protein
LSWFLKHGTKSLGQQAATKEKQKRLTKKKRDDGTAQIVVAINPRKGRGLPALSFYGL